MDHHFSPFIEGLHKEAISLFVDAVKSKSHLYPKEKLAFVECLLVLSINEIFNSHGLDYLNKSIANAELSISMVNEYFDADGRA